MTTLLDAARQALAALEYMYHTADPGPARDVSMGALDALRTAIAEAGMSVNLPPLPDWLQLTNDEVRSRVRAYGQQCWNQALEEAALRFEQVGGMIDPRSTAAAIRTLKDKP